MRSGWLNRPDLQVVVGSFGAVEAHHHPAVQLAVALDGDLHVTDGDGESRRGRAVVIASGARHATSATGDSMSVYLSPESDVAAALNAGVLVQGGAGVLLCAEPSPAIERAVVAGDLEGAADLVVALALARVRPPLGAVAVHPQVREAIEAVIATIPGRASLTDVAGEVALSPDYLGRLFRTQTGTSFAAMVRWRRLLAALEHVEGGASITDAAHLAGFADGAHATHACRALTGAAPSALIRALG